ncbi:MAG: FAD-dependent oxidoreductase, partial [Acidimicrobiia bacterium]|nr:FAD-dependent oxidoreductase [Acidimicrobiia bacterium]
MRFLIVGAGPAGSAAASTAAALGADVTLVEDSVVGGGAPRPGWMNRVRRKKKPPARPTR